MKLFTNLKSRENNIVNDPKVFSFANIPHRDVWTKVCFCTQLSSAVFVGLSLQFFMYAVLHVTILCCSVTTYFLFSDSYFLISSPSQFASKFLFFA
jgi:hypothetical protein